jgi:hypothetical protein
LVSASGAEPSGRIDVEPFAAVGGINSELTVMGMATANISNGVNGEVISFGTLTGLDTRGDVASGIAVGDETWAAGDILFAHPTVAGKLTKVRPQHDLAVAFITVRHASTGQIAVRIVPGNNHLEWMHDVLISGSVQNGESLVWNSASGLWMNQLVSGGGGATTTISETAPATPSTGDSWYKQSTGSFFIYDGSYWVEVNGIIDGLTEDQVQDYASTLFTHNSHTNITATYDDANNKLILVSNAQDLSPYLTQASASTIYLTQASASTTYATQVDLDNIDALPSQSGNAGKYLTTSGSVASWGTLDLSLYLTQSSASTTYATQAALNSINGESDQFILPGQIFG